MRHPCITVCCYLYGDQAKSLSIYPFEYECRQKYATSMEMVAIKLLWVSCHWHVSLRPSAKTHGRITSTVGLDQSGAFPQAAFNLNYNS